MSGALIEVIKNSEQKSELWQWDTGRQIKITLEEDSVVDEVHFSNAYSKDALVVKPQVNAEGNIVADIPNVLLWQGLTIKHDGSEPRFLITAIGSIRTQNKFVHNGLTRVVLVKIGGYFAAKIMRDDLTEPELVTEGTIGYTAHDGNLLLGAYQDNSGNKGRWFNGTISKCKVYVGDLPTDEETNAFLMGA